MADERRVAGQRAYPVAGNGQTRPPDYDRVIRRLSDEELLAELDANVGPPGYQSALRAEFDRRRA
jgi:hypothetical protein